MEFNISRYNSPFNIAASGLNVSAVELDDLLNRFFEKYGVKQGYVDSNAGG